MEYFKDDYLKQITPKDINRYMKQLPKTYARKTCTTRLNILNMIFKFSVVEELCENNPCEYVTVPKGHGAKKRRAPTEEEIKKINSSLGVMYHHLDVGLLAIFFFYTGLRKGEALALQYKDIDREAAQINVNKSVYYINNDPSIKKPKTEAGERKVIVPDYLLKLLPNGKPSHYLFGETPEKLMRQHFFEKAWARWQKETGLTLTAHQLRHGHATLMHDAGIDVKDAQAQLGHSDISTTQNIYTEVSTYRRAVAAKQLNDFIQ